MPRPLPAIFVSLFSLTLFACATETASSSTPETGTVRQAATNEGDGPTDAERRCRADCIDYGLIPCSKNCGKGPGTMACIEKCVEEEEECRSGCKGESTERTPPMPNDSTDELSPGFTVKPPAVIDDYSLTSGKLKP